MTHQPIRTHKPFPAVPIYRQLVLANDLAPCDSVCDGPQLGCQRAALMAGAPEWPSAVSDHQQRRVSRSTQTDKTCRASTRAGGGGQLPAGTNLCDLDFICRQRHQADLPDLRGRQFDPATDGRWVRVQPHVFHAVDSGGGNNLIVEDCTNCGGLPAVTVHDGIRHDVQLTRRYRQ